MVDNITDINKRNNNLSPQIIWHNVDHTIWGWKSRAMLEPDTWIITSTNKTDRHYLAEICLKLAFNAINLSQPYVYDFESFNM
jgi:hypothetical protein